MFSFWKKRKAEPQPAVEPTAAVAPAAAPAAAQVPAPAPAPAAVPVPVAAPAPVAVPDLPATSAVLDMQADDVETVPTPPVVEEARKGWMSRLRSGLSKTSKNLTTLFVGVKVDEALFEELETALLMADAGVDATEYLLGELRRRIKAERIETAEGVKTALRDLLIELLHPLEKTMVLGR
jgi:fused signal recognition particle receptor